MWPLPTSPTSSQVTVFPFQSLSLSHIGGFLFLEQARHLECEHLYICHCLHTNTLLQSQAWLAPFSSFRSQVITRSSFSVLSRETLLLPHQVILRSYFSPSTQENLNLQYLPPLKLESELPRTGVRSALLTTGIPNTENKHSNKHSSV